MPAPKTFPCGGSNQPACPPQPAAASDEPLLYTLSDMQEHGQACYEKGRDDERSKKFSHEM